MTDKLMTVGELRKMISSFNDNTPVVVSGGNTLSAIFNIKEYVAKDLEGFSFNINYHKFIHEAGSAIILEADHD